MPVRPHSLLLQSLEVAKRAVAIMLLVACSSPPAAPAQSANPAETWSMYRGDLARDGHPPTATLTEQSAARLAIAWRADLIGAVDGTPAVAGGMVIAGSAGGTLAAFDARTGATVWARHGLGAIAGSPTVAADRVYVGTLTGHVHARRLSNGDGIWDWHAPPNVNVWASPVAYGDLVIAGMASPYGDNPLVPGRLFGLDAATGRERWMMCVRPDCAPGDGVWSTPAVDASGRAFVGVGNPEDGLLAFDPSTGKRTWLASLYPGRPAPVRGFGESADWDVRARSVGRCRDVAPRERPARVLGACGWEWCRGFRQRGGLRRSSQRLDPRPFDCGWSCALELRHALRSPQRTRAGRGSRGRRGPRGRAHRVPTGRVVAQLAGACLDSWI
ncbi:MAG: hypothetical protein E6I41_06045 [Chloroflexi bacterium]|nr:MAG: hypothetical protein E6I41_06045 [Chloroflexota bacterium]